MCQLISYALKVGKESMTFRLQDTMTKRRHRWHWGNSYIGLKWKRMYSTFIYICVKCQSTKSICKKKFGLYWPLQIPNDSWESVSMDFMTQFPKWNGMDTMLVVIDQFFKLAKMMLKNHDHLWYEEKKFDMWVKHHEMPQFIISNYDAKLMTGFLKTFVLEGGDEIVI